MTSSRSIIQIPAQFESSHRYNYTRQFKFSFGDHLQSNWELLLDIVNLSLCLSVCLYVTIVCCGQMVTDRPKVTYYAGLLASHILEIECDLDLNWKPRVCPVV